MLKPLTWQTVIGGKLLFIENFLQKQDAANIYQTLLQNTPWQQEAISMFGRTILQPRLQAWYGDQAYQYSGLLLKPCPMPTIITTLKCHCEQICGHKFNTALLNLYRDGKDSMGWHQDNEKELGNNPVIASVSLGATRKFSLKRVDGSSKIDYQLNHGSLLIMAGELQHFWRHSLPKSRKVLAPRINITFRYVLPNQ